MGLIPNGLTRVHLLAEICDGHQVGAAATLAASVTKISILRSVVPPNFSVSVSAKSQRMSIISTIGLNPTIGARMRRWVAAQFRG